MKSQFLFVVILLLVSSLTLAGTGGDSPSSAPATTQSSTDFSGPFKWKSTGPLISAISDPAHKLLSIKDPSVVFFNDRWHIYATTADTAGHWNMVYLNFTDWSAAAAAKPYYMDSNPNFRGYHCAPEVFYFTPQKKWYLICQSPQPTYSTNDDISKPQNWSRLENFFVGKPPGVVKGWIDYWVICDDANAYLFFSDDDGRFYRSQTKIADFPKGFSNPVIAMQDKNRYALFEGSCTYHLKNSGKYLTIIEAIGPNGHRFFKAFTLDHLDGEFKPLADTWENPFAGINNVTFDDAAKPWTNDISHGEMLRDGYDQTLTIDPANLQFLYQGRDPASEKIHDYAKLPWQLGLIRLDK
jgi:Glycosyl hydrolase family 62